MLGWIRRDGVVHQNRRALRLKISRQSQGSAGQNRFFCPVSHSAAEKNFTYRCWQFNRVQSLPNVRPRFAGTDTMQKPAQGSSKQRRAFPFVRNCLHTKKSCDEASCAKLKVHLLSLSIYSTIAKISAVWHVRVVEVQSLWCKLSLIRVIGPQHLLSRQHVPP